MAGRKLERAARELRGRAEQAVQNVAGRALGVRCLGVRRWIGGGSTSGGSRAQAKVGTLMRRRRPAEGGGVCPNRSPLPRTSQDKLEQVAPGALPPEITIIAAMDS